MFLVLLLIVLYACANNNEDAILKNVSKVVDDSEDGYELISNNFQELFSYYLPSDVNEIECGLDYCVFSYNDSKIYANLNIAGIISEKYYKDYILNDDGFLNHEKIVFHDSGKVKKDDNSIPFYINIYKYDDIYYIHYFNTEINVYASSKLSNLPALTKRIFILDSGIYVDKDVIVTNYSNKSVIDYEKKPIDLFEYIVPSEGILEELLIEKENKVNDE